MFTTVQFGKTRDFGANYVQNLLTITCMAREITEEMLDAIEAVKGSRTPGLWDPRCEQYMNNQKKPKKAKPQTPVN